MLPKIEIVFLTMALLLGLQPASARAADGDPRSTLEGTVDKAIVVLEAKDNKQFIASFVSRQGLVHYLRKKSASDWADELSGSAGIDLLNAFRRCKTLTPEIDASNPNRARYFFRKDKFGGGEWLSFTKCSGTWYFEKRVNIFICGEIHAIKVSVEETTSPNKSP